MSKTTGTQLLDRAISILTYLGEHGSEGVKASTLAEKSGLTAPTSHRIISALGRHGLIERDEATKRYRLGLALFTLATQAVDGTGFRRICHPALLHLAAKTSDTVLLMVRNGFNTVCVDRQMGNYTIETLTGRIGGHIPLGVGPASQAILAFLNPEEVDIILETNAPLYGNYNGLSADEIRQQLPHIKQQGYAADHGRLVEGISGVAIPIRPQNRDVTGSVAINMTSARLSADRLPTIVKLLQEQISAVEKSLNPLDLPLHTASAETHMMS